MDDQFNRLFGDELLLIAGPCVIESEEHTWMMARELRRITADIGVKLVFKASFDKANRSSVQSFRGPGLEAGLKLLHQIKDELGLPVLSDVHCVTQVKAAAEILDIIQIPAFLSRQTDLIVAAAETGKVINVKKAQFSAPEDMKNVVEKVYSTGNRRVFLTERGVSFGYNRLVVDMKALPIMRALGVPGPIASRNRAVWETPPGETGDSSRSYAGPRLQPEWTGCFWRFMTVPNSPNRTVRI
jgi:2-dehydro-3-deoxyphosphooctonate aldolase (KDO 8-P synthase)